MDWHGTQEDVVERVFRIEFERKERKARDRAAIVRLQADQAQLRSDGRDDKRVCQIVLNVSPAMLREIALQMEMMRTTSVSDAVRALIEVGLAAQKGTG